MIKAIIQSGIIILIVIISFGSIGILWRLYEIMWNYNPLITICIPLITFWIMLTLIIYIDNKREKVK